LETGMFGEARGGSGIEIFVVLTDAFAGKPRSYKGSVNQ
jgi:hypothetical protein